MKPAPLSLSETDKLAEIALVAAMKGADRYLARQAEEIRAGINREKLASRVRVCASEAIGEAMKDAREAIACRMPEVAEQTFLLSMGLAGVDAARAEIGEAARRFRDFVNGFLTVSAFASYYGIAEDEARALIAAGRVAHEAELRR